MDFSCPRCHNSYDQLDRNVTSICPMRHIVCRICSQQMVKNNEQCSQCYEQIYGVPNPICHQYPPQSAQYYNNFSNDQTNGQNGSIEYIPTQNQNMKQQMELQNQNDYSNNKAMEDQNCNCCNGKCKTKCVGFSILAFIFMGIVITLIVFLFKADNCYYFGMDSCDSSRTCCNFCSHNYYGYDLYYSDGYPPSQYYPSLYCSTVDQLRTSLLAGGIVGCILFGVGAIAFPFSACKSYKQ